MIVADPKYLADIFGLEGQTAIITGAASGIGLATARMFAHAGANVVIADLDGEAARRSASELLPDGGSALGVATDVSNQASVEAMAAACLSRFGAPTILVNNAAYRAKADFMTMPVSEWDLMHEVNTRGVFLCMRAVIPLMKSRGLGGSIVNISTIGAEHPTIFNNLHYDSSKAGVNAITRGAAIEFAADKIRVNGIMPGGVDTEGSRRMRDGEAGPRPVGPMTLAGRMPYGLARPDQLASAILFFASPASSYVTGQVLAVDGGYSVS